jgi:hypothetical protein
MQISNAPTNGYVLTAQSGNTGGLTWAEAAGGGATPSAVESQFTQTQSNPNLSYNLSKTAGSGKLIIGQLFFSQGGAVYQPQSVLITAGNTGTMTVQGDNASRYIITQWVTYDV